MAAKRGVAWMAAAVLAGAGLVSFQGQPAEAAAASAVTCSSAWRLCSRPSSAGISRPRTGAGSRPSRPDSTIQAGARVLAERQRAFRLGQRGQGPPFSVLSSAKRKSSSRYLTQADASLATAMITQSDNNAASALWADVGRTWLQRFLNLAQMTHTVLGPGVTGG